MVERERIPKSFFQSDVLDVAPNLLGKIIVRHFENGMVKRYRITETEAYRGEEDLACHASKGRTPRTEVMYHAGGQVYVYLIYGMHWMLNFVSNNAGYPSAVLIRGVKGVSGPGRVGKCLELDLSFYGEDLQNSNRIWLEDDGFIPDKILTSKRIGIDYAKEWKDKAWRFCMECDGDFQ